MDDADERARQARDTHPFLTTKQTAHYLGVTMDTLKKMRATNRGPRCRKHGRRWAYHIDDIETWSLAHARGGPA